MARLYYGIYTWYKDTALFAVPYVSFFSTESVLWGEAYGYTQVKEKKPQKILGTPLPGIAYCVSGDNMGNQDEIKYLVCSITGEHS